MMSFHLQAFSRWCGYGVWETMHSGCVHQPGLQADFIDSTVNRGHPCAAGAAGSTAEHEALGRSRGGFSTKIHAITDALGNPLEFVLTGGQASDIGQAEKLLALAPAAPRPSSAIKAMTQIPSSWPSRSET
jgi:transposase